MREFALEWMPDAWKDIDRSRDWLLELADRFKPSVVHLNSYASANALWNAPVISVAHSCVVSWWHAVHDCAPGGEWQEYSIRVRQGLAAAAAVVAPSRFMAEAVITHYGVNPEKTHVIPNFTAGNIPRSRPKQPFVLAAGRMWDHAKNLTLLETIADKLYWPLMIAGNELMADSSRAIQLGRLTHQDLLGRMSDAAIFAHPALYEPFGLAVLEAAKVRCCLVLADIPSLRELWDGAAHFIDPRDAEGWSREINRLIGDTEERERLAALALARANKYTAALALPMYIDIYEHAVSGQRTPSGAAA